MRKNKIVYIKDLKKKKARKQAIKEICEILGFAVLGFGFMYAVALVGWCL